MNQLISDDYLEQNIELHKIQPTYGCSGWQYRDAVLELCATFSTEDVLDYGAGKGTLAEKMPWPIAQYDPAIPEISAWPYDHDIVVCGDVLEHIEPELLGNVLAHIRDVTKLAAYFVIGTRPAGKNLPDGRNAHLIQKPAEWWANQLGLSGFAITSSGTGRKAEAIFTCLPN